MSICRNTEKDVFLDAMNSDKINDFVENHGIEPQLEFAELKKGNVYRVNMHLYKYFDDQDDMIEFVDKLNHLMSSY